VVSFLENYYEGIKEDEMRGGFPAKVAALAGRTQKSRT